MSNATAKQPAKKMSLADFKAALEQGEFKDFGSLYNEQVQTAYTARVFNRLKFEPRIAKLLFVPLMLSMPFNPLTGEADDQHNSRRKFRPFVRPDEFLMQIKALCHEDENLKKRYMDYAGYTGKWDTKPTEEFTDTDRAILFIYRRPMTASHPAIRINNQAITGERYGGQFLLNTKQDALTGEFIGDISKLHKLGLLANALQRLEINSFNTALTEQKADCISLDLGRSFITAKTFTDIKDLDSNEAKTVRGQIRGSYPLGNVSPLVTLPMIGIDVEPLTGNIKTFVPGEDGEEVEQLLPQFRNPITFEGNLLVTDKFTVIDKVNAVIGNYFPKDPSRKKERNVDRDVYANFVILEYITDNDAASFASDTDRNMAAQKMEAKMERDNTAFYHRKKKWLDPELADFMERMAGFYDYAQKDNFAKRMPELMMSNYKTATEVIEDRAIKIFSEDFNLGEEYAGLFNPDILATHKDILMEMWPEDFAAKFDDFADKLDEGESTFETLLEESGDQDSTTGEGEEGVEISADEIEV